MPIAFSLRTAGEITFGAAALSAPSIAARFGRRVLLVVGGASLKRSGALERMVCDLEGLGATAVVEHVTGEPETGVADACARACRDAGCDVILAVGGGSVLDTAKAAAVVVAKYSFRARFRGSDRTGNRPLISPRVCWGVTP